MVGLTDKCQQLMLVIIESEPACVTSYQFPEEIHLLITMPLYVKSNTQLLYFMVCQ